MKLQKKNHDDQVVLETQDQKETVNLKELKALELKIDTQNNRITKLLSSIEKMAEMNAQLVVTIEEMLYSMHHENDATQNVVKEIKTEQQAEVAKVKYWVKIN